MTWPTDSYSELRESGRISTDQDGRTHIRRERPLASDEQISVIKEATFQDGREVEGRTYYQYNGYPFDSMEAAIAARDARQRAIGEESYDTFRCTDTSRRTEDDRDHWMGAMQRLSAERRERMAAIENGLVQGNSPTMNEPWQKPEPCKGCMHYYGKAHHGQKGVNRLICGMHPYGPEGDECRDREAEPEVQALDEGVEGDRHQPQALIEFGCSAGRFILPVGIPHSFSGEQARDEQSPAELRQAIELTSASSVASIGEVGDALRRVIESSQYPIPEELRAQLDIAEQEFSRDWESDPLGLVRSLKMVLKIILAALSEAAFILSDWVDAIGRWLRDRGDDLL